MALTDNEINESVAKRLGWYDGKLPGAKSPDFCHDIRAAWEVVKFISKEYDCEIGFSLFHHTENSKEKWECILPSTTCAPPYEEMDPLYVRETADTAPMAICLAFLKLP